MPRSPLPPLLALCGDPGGGAALAPVLRLLRRQGEDATILAYRQSAMLLPRQGLPCEILPDQPLSPEAIAQRLGNHRLLLTATSVNGTDHEKYFIAAARARGIPSLALLDFPSTYRARFADERDHLTFLPDAVAVMDRHTRNEMIAAGFPRGVPRMTGQPAFDHLAALRLGFTAERRRSARQRLGAREGEILVLFVSQPLREMFGEAWGFSQEEVLSDLLDALAQVAPERSGGVLLAIRPHPRENPEAFDGVGAGIPGLRVVVDRHADGLESVLAADWVGGMNSVLLMEACLLGRPVVSLQPGLRLPDPLPSNRAGASLVITQREEIAPVVRACLTDALFLSRLRRRAEGLQVNSNAALRVVRLLRALWRLRSTGTGLRPLRA
ncbi:MAG: hypothetical protein HQL51_04580 [Magnetococcales bacterium]|nr:hypothetical protein [Magnetococcales bacterium]